MTRAVTKIRFADIAVCIITVSAALIILAFTISSSATSAYVSVTADNIKSSYSLTDNHIANISSCGYDLTLEIKDGAVRVSECNCPDKVCVATGWIEDSTKIIVCTPAKAVIRIENSGGGTDADFIAGR